MGDLSLKKNSTLRPGLLTCTTARQIMLTFIPNNFQLLQLLVRISTEALFFPFYKFSCQNAHLLGAMYVFVDFCTIFQPIWLPMDCFIPGRCSYWDFLKVIGYWKFQKIIVIPFKHLQKLYWFWKFEGCSSKIRRATPIWILKWFWQEIHFFVHLEPSSSGFK